MGVSRKAAKGKVRSEINKAQSYVDDRFCAFCGFSTRGGFCEICGKPFAPDPAKSAGSLSRSTFIYPIFWPFRLIPVLSGFNFAKKMSNDHSACLIQSTVQTPLGIMIALVANDKLCLLEFTDRPILASEYKALTRHYQAEVQDGEHPLIAKLQAELDAYFAGTLQEFTIPLEAPGTPFQQQVWDELLRIPFGTTRSYKQQAIALQNLPAIRAVAQANGMNRIAILIPCHRVIGESGKLTGYGGGLWRKQRLLELESAGRQGTLF